MFLTTHDPSLGMDKFLSDQELNLMLKSIGTRMDWLSIERDRHADMIRNPLLAQYKETNVALYRKIEDQLVSLRRLRKRLLTEPPLRMQMMHYEEGQKSAGSGDSPVDLAVRKRCV